MSDQNEKYIFSSLYLIFKVSKLAFPVGLVGRLFRGVLKSEN